MSTVTSKLQQQAIDLLDEMQIYSYGLREKATQPESLQSASIALGGSLAALQTSLQEAFDTLIDGDRIFIPDLETIYKFAAINRITSTRIYQAMETNDAGYVEGLELNFIRIVDFSSLASLEHLTKLFLDSANIGDISAIVDFKKLDSLSLVGNQISNIDSLASLTNLANLYLGGNEITDITVISSLKELEYLDLESNHIKDLSPIAKCQKLTTLDIDYSPGMDLSFLRFLPKLKDLGIQGNKDEINCNPVIKEILQTNITLTIKGI